jgi:hypothetical protein
MYKITQAYCWYNKGEEIVRMYFINSIPFTFDELDKDAIYDIELIKLADQQLRWEPEDLYRTSFYLIDEEAHPCLFDLELENPECMPPDYD